MSSFLIEAWSQPMIMINWIRPEREREWPVWACRWHVAVRRCLSQSPDHTVGPVVAVPCSTVPPAPLTVPGRRGSSEDGDSRPAAPGCATYLHRITESGRSREDARWLHAEWRYSSSGRHTRPVLTQSPTVNHAAVDYQQQQYNNHVYFRQSPYEIKKEVQ